MKWRRETQAYMWAHYYSEDGRWKAYDEDVYIKGGSRKKFYNPKTHKMENEDLVKHVWFLVNLQTGEKLGIEFKTLKQAKEYAEAHTEEVEEHCRYCGTRKMKGFLCMECGRI